MLQDRLNKFIAYVFIIVRVELTLKHSLYKKHTDKNEGGESWHRKKGTDAKRKKKDLKSNNNRESVNPVVK